MFSGTCCTCTLFIFIAFTSYPSGQSTNKYGSKNNCYSSPKSLCNRGQYLHCHGRPDQAVHVMLGRLTVFTRNSYRAHTDSTHSLNFPICIRLDLCFSGNSNQQILHPGSPSPVCTILVIK